MLNLDEPSSGALYTPFLLAICFLHISKKRTTHGQRHPQESIPSYPKMAENRHEAIDRDYTNLFLAGMDLSKYTIGNTPTIKDHLVVKQKVDAELEADRNRPPPDLSMCHYSDLFKKKVYSISTSSSSLYSTLNVSRPLTFSVQKQQNQSQILNQNENHMAIKTEYAETPTDDFIIKPEKIPPPLLQNMVVQQQQQLQPVLNHNLRQGGQPVQQLQQQVDQHVAQQHHQQQPQYQQYQQTPHVSQVHTSISNMSSNMGHGYLPEFADQRPNTNSSDLHRYGSIMPQNYPAIHSQQQQKYHQHNLLHSKNFQYDAISDTQQHMDMQQQQQRQQHLELQQRHIHQQPQQHMEILPQTQARRHQLSISQMGGGGSNDGPDNNNNDMNSNMTNKLHFSDNYKIVPALSAADALPPLQIPIITSSSSGLSPSLGHALDFAPKPVSTNGVKFFNRCNQLVYFEFSASLYGKFLVNKKYLKTNDKDDTFPIACYRRNFSSVLISLYMSDEPVYLEMDGLFYDVENVKIILECTSNFSVMPAELIFHPTSTTCKETSSLIDMNESELNLGTFKGRKNIKMRRFQFKKATPNNGKYIAKDYYYMTLQLVCDVKESAGHDTNKRKPPFTQTILTLKSNGISVRGRNPSFYTERNDECVDKETSTCFKIFEAEMESENV